MNPLELFTVLGDLVNDDCREVIKLAIRINTLKRAAADLAVFTGNLITGAGLNGVTSPPAGGHARQICLLTVSVDLEGVDPLELKPHQGVELEFNSVDLGVLPVLIGLKDFRLDVILEG